MTVWTVPKPTHSQTRFCSSFGILPVRRKRVAVDLSAMPMAGLLVISAFGHCIVSKDSHGSAVFTIAVARSAGLLKYEQGAARPRQFLQSSWSPLDSSNHRNPPCPGSFLSAQESASVPRRGATLVGNGCRASGVQKIPHPLRFTGKNWGRAVSSSP